GTSPLTARPTSTTRAGPPATTAVSTADTTCSFRSSVGGRPRESDGTDPPHFSRGGMHDSKRTTIKDPTPMTMTPEQAAWFQGTFHRLVDNVDRALQGKREIVSLVLASMLAEGHVLLEDAPGTGKTSLAKALAATVQGTSARIQFTPDLLPSDVTGVTIYDQQSHRFEFHKGPIFASIVLADE